MEEIYTDGQLLVDLELKRYDDETIRNQYWNGCYQYPEELKNFKGLLDLL